MKLPKKIGIIDSTQSTDSRLRFDDWEGFDPKLQVKYLAYKLNEILDFLEKNPDLRNDIPALLKRDGDKAVHVHEWRLLQRVGSHGFFDCPVCGETIEKVMQGA